MANNQAQKNPGNEGENNTGANNDGENLPPNPPKPAGRGATGAPTPRNQSINVAGVKEDLTRSMTNDAKAVKKKLSVEPKVPYTIPLGFGEKVGAEESVTINGYRIVIKKGVRVMLPMTVVDLLDEYLNIQNAVGLDARIDLKNDEDAKFLQ